MSSRNLPAVFLVLLLAGCEQSGSFSRNNLAAPLAPSTLDASADHLIRIIGGSLTISRTTTVRGTVELKGTRGFRLLSDVSYSGGVFAPYSRCPCPPGTPIDLAAVWVGIDLFGQVRLRGTSYDVGHANGPGALVEFTGQVTAPPPNASGFAEVSAPFSFEGLVQTPPEWGLGGPLSLTGHGQAHLQFTFTESVHAWEFLHARYEFEPAAAHGHEE